MNLRLRIGRLQALESCASSIRMQLSRAESATLVRVEYQCREASAGNAGLAAAASPVPTAAASAAAATAVPAAAATATAAATSATAVTFGAHVPAGGIAAAAILASAAAADGDTAALNGGSGIADRKDCVVTVRY